LATDPVAAVQIRAARVDIKGRLHHPKERRAEAGGWRKGGWVGAVGDEIGVR
jgi:hypothetical protein